jgi:YD repeat-containing protein
MRGPFGSTTDSDVFPNYTTEGTLKSIFIGGQKGQGNKYNSWMRLSCDQTGRPVEITDQWGLKVKLEYDKEGKVCAVAEGSNRITMRQDKGRSTLQASWGLRQAVVLDKAGQVERTEIEEGGRKALIEYVNGMPSRMKQFDGGETHVDYFQDGPNQGRPSQVRTAVDLVVDYEYSPNGRFAGLTSDNVRRTYIYDELGRITGCSEAPLE